MEGKEYSVSEAVRLIGVESHVLRYWEEELPIEIRRSAQGHRIYSEEDIETFRRVRELKEKGLQLKAIRLLMDRQGRLDPGGPARDAGFAERICGLAAGREAGREKHTADEPGVTGGEACGMDGRTNRAADSPGSAERTGCACGSPGGAEGTGCACGSSGGSEGTGCTDGSSEPLRGEIVAVDETEPLRQFEQILRRLMEEVVSEQNEKLEETIAGRMREELEEFYLQYERSAREAAVALEAEAGRSGVLRRVLRRLLRPRK